MTHELDKGFGFSSSKFQFASSSWQSPISDNIYSFGYMLCDSLTHLKCHSEVFQTKLEEFWFFGSKEINSL